VRSLATFKVNVVKAKNAGVRADSRILQAVSRHFHVLTSNRSLAQWQLLPATIYFRVNGIH
jgi:hypothetical protein